MTEDILGECKGCIHAPTRDDANFDEECMGCSRFYPDEFTTTIPNEAE